MLSTHETKLSRLEHKFRRELGDNITAWLHDSYIVEIMLNPDGKLWYQHRSKGLCSDGETFPAAHALNLIGTIASFNDRVINGEHPILECELPIYGHRFEAVIPPVVENPTFCIRMRAEIVYSLDDYKNQGIICDFQRDCLRAAIEQRQTILVVGGPGTGKTTFANALLLEMAMLSPTERIIILEDTRELQSSSANTVFLQTSPNIGFQDLLRAALRLRPDKICLGECRGAEMLTLLKCWNTGTPGGIATLHANSAKAAITRIQEMVKEAGSRPQPQLIVEAVNLIVSISYHPDKGRIVNDIIHVSGFNNQDFQLTSLQFGSPKPCNSNIIKLH